MSLETIKESLKFTIQERRGLWIALAVIGIILSINVYWRTTYPRPELSPEQISELYDLITEQEQQGYTQDGDTIKIAPKKFNPNYVTTDELLALGWPLYPARNVVNYRSKGATYRVKKDLRKIYGMTDELYDAIYPYIDLPVQLDSRRSSKYPSEYTQSPPRKKYKKKPAPKPLVLSDIDPNAITKDQLLDMGIPPRLANNWVNYRSKGKVYRSAEDIQEIYGMDSTLFDQIEPLLRFPESRDVASAEETDTSAPTPVSTTPEPVITVSINSATAEELQQIRGIGPAFSKAFIEYRDRLGGYYSIEQLYEIEWIPRDALDAVIDQIIVEDDYQRIDVRETDFKRLIRHPYLRYETTRIVKSYFKLRPQREELDRFMRTAKINADTLQMLRPYLELREK